MQHKCLNMVWALLNRKIIFEIEMVLVISCYFFMTTKMFPQFLKIFVM